MITWRRSLVSITVSVAQVGEFLLNKHPHKIVLFLLWVTSSSHTANKQPAWRTEMDKALDSYLTSCPRSTRTVEGFWLHGEMFYKNIRRAILQQRFGGYTPKQRVPPLELCAAVGSQPAACVHFACRSEVAEQVYSRWQHKGVFCECVGQTSALQRHTETPNHLLFTYFYTPLIGRHFLMSMNSDIPWINFTLVFIIWVVIQFIGILSWIDECL